jgi:hypothetical protein
MVATTNGFIVFMPDLILHTFEVNLDRKTVSTQVTSAVEYPYKDNFTRPPDSTIISTNLDLLFTSKEDVATFMTATGDRQNIPIPLNNVNKFAFSGDGSRFVLLTELGVIVVFDTASLSILYEMPEGAYTGQLFVSFNGNGTKLLVSDYHTPAILYDLSGSAPQLLSTPLQKVSANPVLLSTGEIITVYNNDIIVANGQGVKSLPIADSRCEMANQIRISPNEKFLALTQQSAFMLPPNLCIADVSALFSATDRDSVNLRVLELLWIPSAIAFSSDSRIIGLHTLGRNAYPHLSIVDHITMTIVAKSNVPAR